MNNDLISREALKEALKSNCKPELCHDYNTAWCEACCPHNDFEDLIDNAPTVEAYTPEQVKELVDLNKKLLEERPQGEFTRRELESWLYAIAINNTQNELGSSCEEIISRLDGFERYVSDMRKGVISCE